MLSDDVHEPYDRTLCSKGFLAGEAPPEWLPLKPPGYYVEAGIERISHRVHTVDIVQRAVPLPGGASLEADGLLLAMGGRPRRLEVAGSDLEGVQTLRSRDDCERLIELADHAEHAVVVGASFIGMEVAASLRQRGIESVTVVAPDQTPFASTLGGEIGGLLRRIHEDNGVAFALGATVASFSGSDRVREVVLDSGQRLAADLVVVGIGVEPATDIVDGVALEDDGSLLADEYLRVREGVYAAGDIVTFPDWRSGRPSRIEHWRVAQQQGEVAARNLLGAMQRFRRVPFFWTMQLGASLGYVGHASGWDRVIVHGDLEERDFMAYFVAGDRLLAGAAMGRDRQLGALHELMLMEREPDPCHLGGDELDLTRLLTA
jgi:NADPH-dependent 2,4-dienoyl-CoA reductase/sulfur reductase-like enzyme